MSEKKVDLSELRAKINDLDASLLQILAERKSVAKAVASYKASNAVPVYDQVRERELLQERLEMASQAELDPIFVRKLFECIMADSRSTQNRWLQEQANVGLNSEVVKVAFHAPTGSYSHLAAQQHFSSIRVAYQSFETYQEVLQELERGAVDYCVLPIESRASGALSEIYNLIQHSQVVIIGEELIEVKQALVAKAELETSKITKVLCLVTSAVSCSNFLKNYNVEYCKDPETLLTACKGNDAIIISPEIAVLNNLTVLKDSVANAGENLTRFIILSRKAIKVEPQVSAKVSLVLACGQQAGALAEILTVFKDKGIALSKIENKSVLSNPTEELFYLDFLGNLSDSHVADAIAQITKLARFIKVLGCYPISGGFYQTASVVKKEEKKSEPKVVKSSKGYKLASREAKSEDTIIQVGDVRIGEGFVFIGGPCSVESREQIFSCAEQMMKVGGQILRGGCFKPRTSPYSFQGMGYAGLDLLAEAGKTYNLPVITEVMTAEDVEKVAEKSDMIQIGARNMQNFNLLAQVGRTQRPVLLKRGMSASIEDLLYAAEYILAAGNQQVILCERGIRTFETATRNTLDLSAIPVLKRLTHLPIIVDPSHAVGERDLVIPMALAAKAVGAHGIMVEFHPKPEEALSDGPQALRYPQLAELMLKLKKVHYED